MADNEQSEHSPGQNLSWLEKLKAKYSQIAGQNRPLHLTPIRPNRGHETGTKLNLIAAADIILELVSILDWVQPFIPSSPRMKVCMIFSARGIPEGMQDYYRVHREVAPINMGGLSSAEDSLNFQVNLPDPEEALKLLKKLEILLENGEILLTVKGIIGPMDCPDDPTVREQMKGLRRTATQINKKVAAKAPETA